MKTIVIALMLAARAFAVEPRVVFEKQGIIPVPGIPKEARLQKNKTATLENGTLAKLLGESTQSITVNYFSDVWTPGKLEDYLVGLLAADSTSIYTFEIWSNGAGEPEVDCSLAFKNGKKGRLLLWDTRACISDPQGRWWFVTLFDHYHRNHPHGTRSNDKKP